jgi:hypothetical protein
MGVLSAMLRPSEFMALLRLKKKIGEWKKRAAAQEKDADWEFCFDMLNKVSRSFAIVIEQLGDELRNAICIFYLVLRGLDTVGMVTSQTQTNSLHLRMAGRQPFAQKDTTKACVLACFFRRKSLYARQPIVPYTSSTITLNLEESDKTHSRWVGPAFFGGYLAICTPPSIRSFPPFKLYMPS